MLSKYFAGGLSRSCNSYYVSLFLCRRIWWFIIEWCKYRQSNFLSLVWIMQICIRGIYWSTQNAFKNWNRMLLYLNSNIDSIFRNLPFNKNYAQHMYDKTEEMAHLCTTIRQKFVFFSLSLYAEKLCALVLRFCLYATK